MYTLYVDKAEDFKCNIGVEGANIKDTLARLVLESKDMNLLYEGTVSSDGSCTIPVKKLKNILEEGTTGKMKLEVIAEDTFFSPWEDDFTVKAKKQVKVEVMGSNKPIVKETKINVTVNKPKAKTKPGHGKVIAQILEKKNITPLDFKTKSTEIGVLIENYMEKFNIPDSKLDDIITETINNFN
jgi:hypothetical protein